MPYVVLAAVSLAALLTSRSSHSPAVVGVMFVTAELIGLGFCVRLARHHQLAADERRAWRYLGIWSALGIVVGAVEGATLPAGLFAPGKVPFLIVVLVCRLAMVPLELRGLLSFSGEPLTHWGRRKLALDVITVVGAGVMASWYFLIGPALFDDRLRSDVLRFSVVLFPVCDLAVMLGLATVLLRGVVTAARRSLLLLLPAVLLSLVSDLVLTYASYLAGHTGVAFWENGLPQAALVTFAAAGIERCRSAGDRHEHAADPRPLRPYAVLPQLALAGGYLLLVVVAARAGAFPWLGLVAGAVIMTFGVAARQIVSLRENHELVITDSLTGLPNRLLLRDRMNLAIERARRSGEPMAVLLIDLDGFKQVNDTYGHDAGDAVLVTFAGILRRHVRGTDTPARLGGDEFAVLLDGLTSAQDAIAIAQRLIREVRDAPVVDGVPRVGCSIGIAVADPHDGADLSDPHKQLREADQAMYVAKRAKTTGWYLYSHELEQAVDTAVHHGDEHRATASSMPVQRAGVDAQIPAGGVTERRPGP